MKVKTNSVDEYLATLDEEQREALQKLRQTIQKIAPLAEECISYGIPAFRYNGMLVGFGATKNHCAFYLMSATTVEVYKDDLKKYDTSKGTIRFTPDQPLPISLIRKLVQARITENEERTKEKKN